VKSDGVYIFTASEDKILVLDLDGQLLKTVSMPPVEIPFDPNGQVKPGDTVEFVPSEQADTSAFNSSGSASSTTTTAEARSSFIPPYNPKPYIQAMLLDSTNQRLVAVVSGYGINYYYYGGYPEATTSSGDTSVFFPPIVSDSKQTKIIVYSIGEGGELTEVSQKTVDGNHVNSYSVGSNIHIVTRTYLNVWVRTYIDIYNHHHKIIK
jgi:plastocyanin